MSAIERVASPLTVPGLGIPVQVIDVSPEHAPEGFSIMLTPKGALVPIVTGDVPRGSMLAVIPPEMAAMLRAQRGSLN